MARIHVSTFGGMIPALEDKLLPNENASFAMNCRLDNGKLRAFKRAVPVDLVTEPAAAQRGELGYDQQENAFFTSYYQGQYPILIRSLLQNAYKQYTASYPYSLSLRTYSVANNVIRGTDYGSATYRVLGVPGGPSVVFNGLLPALRTNKPTARAYCATYVNIFGEESAPGSNTVSIFGNEGDTFRLLINPSFNNTEYELYPISKIKLYRTLGEYETGEQLGNKHNTDWHLVREFPYQNNSFEFYDDITSDKIPADLLLSKEFFMPPQVDAVAMVMLDLGFLVIAYTDGTIRVSERFQYHAYPLRNQITIPEAISSMVALDNVLYVTCKNNSAYQITILLDPSGFRHDVKKYKDKYASRDARSLVSTNFGALFSSPRGLVSLSTAQQVLVTQQMILPQQWNSTFAPVVATWAAGYYIGLNTTGGYNWLMDVPDQISGQTPYGKLTFINHELIPNRGQEAIPGVFSAVYGRDSVYIYDAYTSQLHMWDGLEETANEPYLAKYVWRSKMFVTPAPVTFAAAKITFKAMSSGSTGVIFKLYGDGRLRYERFVNGDEPFRLPHLYKATNWMFELEGYGEVHEVHIATSMTELRGEYRGLQSAV